MNDFDSCLLGWDEKVQSALDHFNLVDQPLLPFIDSDTMYKLQQYLNTGKNYVSVAEQKAASESFAFWTDSERQVIGET